MIVTDELVKAIERAGKTGHAVRISINAMRPLLVFTCTVCICGTVLVLVGNAGTQIVGAVAIVGSLLFFCGAYATWARKSPDSLGVEIVVTPSEFLQRRDQEHQR